MSANNTSGPPKGRSARKPETSEGKPATPGAPPAITDEVSEELRSAGATDEADRREVCRCPEGECRKGAIDFTRFRCRDGNEPEEAEGGQVATTEEVLKDIAVIICQERGEDPEQNYLGRKRWQWAMPEAVTHVRIFNFLVNKALDHA